MASAEPSAARQQGDLWRARTEGALAPYAPDPVTHWLDVRSFHVQLVAHCPDSLAEDGAAFEWTVPLATSAIVRAALAELLEDEQRRPRRCGDPASAVRLALAGGGGLDPNLADWVAQLDRAGHASLLRACLWQVTDARTLVRWPPAGVRAVLAGGRVNASITPAGAKVHSTAVYVHGRNSRTSDDRTFLTLSTRTPPAPQLGPPETPGHPVEIEAAHLALAATLLAGTAPAGVVVLELAERRRTRFTVDDEVLGRALRRVEAVARAVAARRDGLAADAIAGPWCRRCAKRSSCAAATLAEGDGEGGGVGEGEGEGEGQANVP